MKETNELKKRVNDLEKQIVEIKNAFGSLAGTYASMDNIIRFMDAGLFLSIYSLLQNDNIVYPKVSNIDEMANCNVSSSIGKMVQIIDKVRKNTTKEKEDNNAENKSSK